MNKQARRKWMGTLVTALATAACSFPWTSAGPRASATRAAATIYALQTLVSRSPTPEATTVPGLPGSSLPPPTVATYPTPLATPAPTTVVVAQTALCWTGPGPAYPVVSSVKAGTQVTLLGTGSIAGWFVITNPIYRDRCWMEAKWLTLGALDTSGLPVYNPPPTPGPSVTPGPTPTP